MAQEYIESYSQTAKPQRLSPIQAALHIVPAAPVVLVLIAAFLALLVALHTPPAWSIDIGAAGDSRFVSGMLDRERDPVNGAMFRWTEPLARIWLPEFGSFALGLHIYNDTPLVGSRELRIERDGRALGSLQLAEGWRIYHVLLPGSVGDAVLNAPPLELATSAVRTPGDSTDRGFPLDWVDMRPLGQAAPPWRALLLTWGLAVLAGWLWQLDRALLTRRATTRGLRIAALVAAVTAGLVLWALKAPYALAWAIPPTPWVLGLATVLLLASTLAPLRARLDRRVLILGGVALLVAGQALLVTQTAVGLGMGLALVALVAMPHENKEQRTKNKGAGTGEPRTGEPRTENREPQNRDKRQETRDKRQETRELKTTLSPRHLVTLSSCHLVILLFLAALALRFYRIGELPYGLWRDEARHALEGLHILDDPSYRPAYIRQGVDLPGLGMYPFALALRVWGIHDWTLRTITALAGALAILPLYALVRRLYDVRIALLAAALLACSYWDISISRFSFPTIFDPLLQLTALWLVARGLDYRPPTTDHRPPTDKTSPLLSPVSHLLSPVSLFFAGACLGLALQTYHTGRLGLATAGLLALLLLLRAPGRWRSWLLGIAVLGVGFVLAASPLLSYALRNPDSFNQRVGTVFLLSEDSPDKRAPLAKLDESIGRHLLMFNVRGDSNGRHVAPNAPMLDAVTGLGLLAGVAALLHRWRDWRSLFLLGALAIGLAPSILSIESPHAMRSIDALPFACAIAALGLAELWRLLVGTRIRSAKEHEDTRMSRFSFGSLRVFSRGFADKTIAVLALILVLALNAWTYFGSMPADPQVWTASYPYHTRIGVYIRALADEQGPEATRQVYVPEQLADNPVFEYLTYALPVQTFDDHSIPAPVPPEALFVLPNTNSGQAARVLLEQKGLELAQVATGPLLPDGATASFMVYRVLTVQVSPLTEVTQ